MNIATILKKCPKGTKLYSPLFGEVILDCVKDDIENPICCLASDGGTPFFMSDGRYFGDYTDAECMLFPSKDQRDWSIFRANYQKAEHQFKPFDKVLVRNYDTDEWLPGFFYKFDLGWNNPYHIMNLHHLTDYAYRECIPYEGNEHLLGTTNNPE